MKKIILISIILSVSMFSCLEDPTSDENQMIMPDILVLNEGLFNYNNSTLTSFSFLDTSSFTDFFRKMTDRDLGDTGNDIAIYGNKVYIVVNVSSKIEVLDVKTCKSLKNIPLFNGAVPRQPRYIAFNQNKAFVCNFDGTVAVIDTTSLDVEKYIKVGKNPDGIAVANDKIYVSNSGGLDNPDYDSTLSVINIKTLEETKKIKVGLNPYTIKADKYGDLYVVTRGNYGDISAKLNVIDTKTDAVKKTFNDFQALSMDIKGDSSYIYFYDFNTKLSNFLILNVKTEEIVTRKFITDNTTIETPYGICVSPYNSDVYITDAHGFSVTGDVVCFDKSGKKKYSFKVGLNPSKICFYKK